MFYRGGSFPVSTQTYLLASSITFNHFPPFCPKLIESGSLAENNHSFSRSRLSSVGIQSHLSPLPHFCLCQKWQPGPLLLLHSLEENFLFSLDSYGTPECDAEPPGGGPGPAFLNLPVLESLSSLLDFIINFTHPCPVSSISKPKKSMNYNHCLLNSPYFNTSISALLTMPKLLTVWITINCGKF